MSKRKTTLQGMTVSLTGSNGIEHEIDPEVFSNRLFDKDPSIEVRGAVLDGIFCNYTYNHTVSANTINKCRITSAVPVHEDLIKCFKKLNPHLAVICEEVLPGDISDIERIADFDDKVHTTSSIEYKISLFKVSAFKLEGDKENVSVVLTGDKRLTDGDFVSLTTPKKKLNKDYHFATELSIAIDNLLVEVEKYMKGKQAPAYIQQELFNGDEIDQLS